MKFAYAPESRPLDGYTIKRAIDRGGFGEVYYALSDSGKEVALKLLQRNQQVELRGVSQCLNLKHPNLVTIFDLRTDGEGDHWVIMEYVSGKSLEVVLAENPRGLPPEQVAQWLTGLAAGVGFLHDRGIVHRDLKPANVFRENGVVKIGDIGLSKYVTPSRRSAQTESVGTVYYMAPEVAHGKYGCELDIYSLTVMVYEMLTGCVPFDGESTGEILMKHLTQSPDLGAVAPAFRGVLSRGLEKDPQRRTPSAAQLASEFQAAMAGKGPAVEIPPEAFHNQPARPLGRPPAASRVTQPFSADSAPPTSWPSPWMQALQNNISLRRSIATGIILFCLSLMLALFGARQMSAGMIPFLAILGGMSYFVYWLVNFVMQSSRTVFAPSAPPPQYVTRPPAPMPPRGLAETLPHAPSPAPRREPPPVAVHKSGRFSPLLRRRISLRQRVSDLATSMALVVPWTIVATVMVGMFTTLFGTEVHTLGPVDRATDMVRMFATVFSAAPDAVIDPGSVGLFAFTTILGAWTVLVMSKWWEGRGVEARSYRLMLTILGAAVGACAFGLDQLLMVDIPYDNRFQGLIQNIGRQPLLTEGVQPTLVGYMIFFAALFGLRSWWWHADSLRPKRFRLRIVALTVLVAFFLPAAFAFPQSWAWTWAAALSSVIQLSAVWIPWPQRAANVEGG